MIIIAEGLSKVFPARSGGGTLALDGVSMEVKTGEFVSLVGPSGCGKSTLLRIIAGLVSQSDGRVMLDGREVIGPSDRVALVFQQASLLPWRRILANVGFGIQLRGTSRKESRKRAMTAIERVGLLGFENHYPYQLSGGMQQRANLARAFVTKSEVLLMDEPFGSLDAMTRQVMQNELLRLVETQKHTVVFVTHQIEEAVLLSDRILVMSSRPGRVKAEVPVPFDRPRDAELRRAQEFQDLCNDIWHMIEGDVLENI